MNNGVQIKLTEFDPFSAAVARILEVGKDDALRVGHAALLDKLRVEDLELPGWKFNRIFGPKIGPNFVSVSFRVHGKSMI